MWGDTIKTEEAEVSPEDSFDFPALARKIKVKILYALRGV